MTIDIAKADPIVRQIVDRRHVGESLSSVCRYVLTRLQAKTLRRLRATPRGSDERRRLALALWQARAVHRHNRSVYADVMGGRIG